jgi:hypothetical protein
MYLFGVNVVVCVFSMMCLRSSVGMLVYIFVISNEASLQLWCIYIDFRSVSNQ